MLLQQPFQTNTKKECTKGTLSYIYYILELPFLWRHKFIGQTC